MVQMFLMHTKFLKPKHSYQKVGIFTQLFSHFQTLHSNITLTYQSVKNHISSAYIFSNFALKILNDAKECVQSETG
jgi:hypothetical protein